MTDKPRYSDDDTVLIYVPPVTTIIIKRLAKVIEGSNGKYAFQAAVNTIESFSFEEDPLLEVVQPYSFSGCIKLRNADFSMCSHLTTIDNYAFRKCSLLTSVSFPLGIKTIGDYAFYVSGIISLYLPPSLTRLGFRAFSECAGLKSAVFDPESIITEIPGCLFTSSKIANFTVTKSIKTIVTSFLQLCKNVEYIFVDPENTIFYSRDGVMYRKDNSSISYYPSSRTGTYTILDSVTTIESCGFSNTKLEYVVFPSQLKSIGIYAFYQSSIKSLDFPPSLKKLSVNAFGYCKQLTFVNISNGVQTIENACFTGCSNLIRVILPSSIKSLGGAVFQDCNPNISIEFDENSPYTLNTQNMIVDKLETSIVQYIGTNKVLNISSSIKYIKFQAFYQRSITTINFVGTSQLIEIENSAFHSCASLTSFSIPPSVTIIGTYAFYGCANLQSITFGPSLSSIGEFAFYACKSIHSIVFTPGKIVSIGNNAFTYCTSLNSLNFADGLRSLGVSCFQGTSSLKSVTIPPTVTSIGEFCFAQSGITQCAFRSFELQTIPDFCFYQCYSLSDIQYPENVTILGDYSFAFTNISNVTIPVSVSSIEEFCFHQCVNLAVFSIPENSNLTILAFGVFSGCKSFSKINNGCANFEKESEALYNKGKTKFIVLPPKSPIKSFSFPDTLRLVCEGALYECVNLVAIFIPECSIQEIQKSAFEGCSNLKNINIPLSVQTIGENAFKGCSKLQCGLFIENQNPSFLLNLTKTALLPKRCLKECIYLCTMNQIRYYRKNLVYSFIMIFARSF